MGAGKETTSVWVVIASVGVVALAGLVLRVDRVDSSREHPIARRIERERRAEILRQKLRELDERPMSPKLADSRAADDAGAAIELPQPPAAR